MIHKPILSLLLTAFVSLAFTSPALAQQPDPAPVVSLPAPPDAIKSGRGIGQGTGQGPNHKMIVERHIVTEGGPHSEFRLGPPGIWWKNPDLIQKLTITPEQQKRMDDIFQQSRIQLIDLKANVEKQEVLLEPMLDANPPDTNKILAQIDHTAQARAELEKANARMLLGIRTVLTPDQWTRLQTEERGNRHIMFKRKGGPGDMNGPGDRYPLGPEGMLTAPTTSIQTDDPAPPAS